jgi:hypothetical protein
MNTIYQKMIITRRLVASVGGVLAVIALMAACCSYGKVTLGINSNAQEHRLTSNHVQSLRSGAASTVRDLGRSSIKGRGQVKGRASLQSHNTRGSSPGAQSSSSASQTSYGGFQISSSSSGPNSIVDGITFSTFGTENSRNTTADDTLGSSGGSNGSYGGFNGTFEGSAESIAVETVSAEPNATVPRDGYVDVEAGGSMDAYATAKGNASSYSAAAGLGISGLYGEVNDGDLEANAEGLEFLSAYATSVPNETVDIVNGDSSSFVYSDTAGRANDFLP